MVLLPYVQTLRDAAQAAPERPAITHETNTVTRWELEERTNRLARTYQRLGVGEGDFVTIALPNSVAFYEATIATWKLGATPQPVSARLPHRERAEIIELAQPALVVGIADGEHGQLASLPIGYEPDPTVSTEPLLPHRVTKDSKAMTSGGSTGRPKLIVSAQAAEVDLDEASPVDILTDRTLLFPGPLYHNAPFSLSLEGLLRGNHIVVMTRFDAEEVLQLIEHFRVDYTMLVPTMMHRIWRLDADVRQRYDLSSLRVMLHMAAPCPHWLKDAWIDWLGAERVYELYGGTEGQGHTWISGSEWREHRGSVGRPFENCAMKILDSEGKELPPGEVGEVYMMPETGPGSTYRYVGATPRARDGWESLGDIGWMDTDGYLYLSDRRADMILSGGANVYPAEVEAAIDAHPAIRSSAVIGLPDEDLGNRVHAVVDAIGDITEEELLEHLAEYLVRYKIPRSMEFVSQPLRDDAGKIRRSELRAQRLTSE